MNKEYITIEKILKISELKEMKQICCEEDITKEVTGIHIMDNPDTVRFFRNGEIIMTTGYILMNFTQSEYDSLLRHLCERGCSGIIFKINRFYDSVPEDMILAAKKYSIPILTIPYKYAISDVQKIIMREIFIRDFNVSNNNEVSDEIKSTDRDLLSILLAQNSQAAIEEVFQLNGIEQRDEYACIVTNIEDRDSKRIIIDYCKSNEIGIYEYTRNKITIYLIMANTLSGRYGYVEELFELLTKDDSLIKSPQFVCIGQVVDDPVRIKNSYKQACFGYMYAKIKQSNYVQKYSDYSLIYLLHSKLDKDTLYEIYKDFMEYTEVEIHESFGQTESSLMESRNPPDWFVSPLCEYIAVN